jgi:hypothetical protein
MLMTIRQALTFARPYQVKQPPDRNNRRLGGKNQSGRQGVVKTAQKWLM